MAEKLRLVGQTPEEHGEHPPILAGISKGRGSPTGAAGHGAGRGAASLACRRITMRLNRQLRSDGAALVNLRPICLIIKAYSPLLVYKYSDQPVHVCYGRVIVMRPNLHWCPDGFGLTCRKGDLIRGAFLIDSLDREIRSSGKRSPGSLSDPPHPWRTVMNAKISGGDIWSLLPETVGGNS